MADRRTDDTPLAPRRSLTGPQAEQPAQGKSEGARRPLSERVSAALANASESTRSATKRSTSGSSSQASQKSPASKSQGSQSAATQAQSPQPQPRGSRPAPASQASRPPQKESRGSGSAVPASRPRSTRKARLRMTHVDPWSVMKIAFLLSVAFGIVTVVAVAVVWSVLGAAGVWDSINSTVQQVLGGDSARTFDVENYIGTSRVMGFTMVVAVVDVVLITAIATLGAFLYNLAAALLGGLEVTLAEDER